jgi:hypothetical protein
MFRLIFNCASKLKADLKFSEVEASFVDVPDKQEDQILHDAAKVLRGSLHAVEISKDSYPSPSGLSHHRSLQFISLLLHIQILKRYYHFGYSNTFPSFIV